MSVSEVANNRKDDLLFASDSVGEKRTNWDLLVEISNDSFVGERYERSAGDQSL